MTKNETEIKKTTSFKIIDNPSAEALFAALRWRHLNESISFVTFTLQTAEQKIKVKVDSISVEDGSGESWILNVYNLSPSAIPKTAEVYINTRTRKGMMKITRYH